MDVLKHPLRVGATGESNDLFTTSTNTTGPDVEWRFISDGNDAWFIERAAGGSLARLRSDNTEFADMENPNSTGNESWETFSFTDGESFGTSLLTTEGPSSLRRLQVTPTQFGGDVKFLTIASTGSWESFTFTEAGSFLSTKDNTIIGLKIYPNPVTNKVTINGAINSNIKVFDINGKAIFTKAIDRESEILDLSILSPGFYYAEVIKADRRSVIKLVKN